MLSLLGKNFSRQKFEIYFLFCPKNKLWYFMQIISSGDSLHGMSEPIFGEKNKNIINLSSAEFAQSGKNIKHPN